MTTEVTPELSDLVQGEPERDVELEKLRTLSWAKSTMPSYSLAQRRANVDMAVHRFVAEQPSRAPRDLAKLLGVLDHRLSAAAGIRDSERKDARALLASQKPLAYREAKARARAQEVTIDSKLDTLKRKMSASLHEAKLAGIPRLQMAGDDGKALVSERTAGTTKPVTAAAWSKRS